MSYLCLQNMRVIKSGKVSYTAVSMYYVNSIDSTFRPNLPPNVDFFFSWIVRKIVGKKHVYVVGFSVGMNQFWSQELIDLFPLKILEVEWD